MSSGKHEVAGEVAIEITRDLAEPVGRDGRIGVGGEQGCAFELRLITTGP